MYFSYHLSITASAARSLTTLFSTKIRGEETTVTGTSTSLSFKFVGETIKHHYYCMLEINKSVISPYVEEGAGWNAFKV